VAPKPITSAPQVARKAAIRGQPNHPIWEAKLGLTITGEVDPAAATLRGQLAVFGAVVYPWINGQAALAGLQRGDIVTAVNSDDTPSWRAFVAAMGQYGPGQPVELRIARAGDDPMLPEYATVTVTVAGQPT